MAERAQPIVDWLLTEGRRAADAGALLEGFAERLRAHGIDVVRATTGVPVLHPQLYSFSGLWEAGKGAGERRYKTDQGTQSALAHSPIKIVYDGGGPVRCDPTAPPQPGEFEILADLRADGVTDYVVLPLPFSDGSHKALSLATRRPGGFADGDVALFEAVAPVFALLLEIHAQRRTARTLLDTYVGRLSGARVLAGEITRGSGETIRAAVWMCDLRDFTGLSETLPPETLIDMLNAYFGAMCDAVQAEGGEVLKFIGDALLAIFPIEGEDAGPACRAALTAAEAAETRLAEINAARETGGLPPIRYGIALHVGDVHYGNIGGETRLDFTVIGAAVNLAARLEGLCRELGRTLLLSAAFAAASGVPSESLGAFALKGVGARQEVFAPRR